jgi:hypothetical protein
MANNLAYSAQPVMARLMVTKPRGASPILKHHHLDKISFIRIEKSPFSL